MSAAEPKFPPPDPAAFALELTELTSKAQAKFAEMMKTPTARAAFGLEPPPNPDPLNMQSAMQSAVQQLSMDPAKLIQANLKLWQQHMLLWQQMSASMVGTSMGAEATSPVAEPDRGDRRFKHPDWNENHGHCPKL